MGRQLETVLAAWSGAPPDWIIALARACELSSQADVARQMDRSTTVVSQILRNCYAADSGRIEERVRGLFMNGRVECPAQGQIPSHICQDWREKARTFAVSTSQRARMYRACNGCARNKGGSDV